MIEETTEQGNSLEVFKFGIEGISSLLMHNPRGMESSENKAKVTTKQIPAAEEEAERGAYRNELDGTLYLPSIMFRSSLWHGAAYRKIGKDSARNLIQAAVFSVDSRTPLIDLDTGEALRDYQIHTVRAVVQTNGIMRSRPEIERWGCVLRFELDLDFITPEIVAELLNIAGKRAGVGDWRPLRKGPHGRYRASLLGREEE